MQIRFYESKDALATLDLFRSSILDDLSDDYSLAQKRAWANVTDIHLWTSARATALTWVAVQGSQLVGFIDLQNDGLINMLFVHPDFKRTGVASAMFEVLQKRAKLVKIRRLYSHASISAKPFFVRQGFKVVQQQEVAIRGQVLTNYLVQKSIG